MGFANVISSISSSVVSNAVSFLGDVSPLIGVGLAVMVIGLLLSQLRRFM